MDDVSAQLTSLKGKLSESLGQLYSLVEQFVPRDLEGAWNSYVKAITSTGKDDIIHDLSNFKATPATTTLALTTIATLMIFSKLFKLSSTDAPNPPKIKKKKKPTKAQKANKEIQLILDYVEETYVPQIDDYLENYDSLSENDREYRFRYYDEMLLKELMKLDAVDVTNNEVLRENRKKVIKFVQEHQRRLDKFRKDRI